MKILTVDGHLGKDAEIMKTPKGSEFLSLSLANTTYVKGMEKTTWYNVTIFDVNSLRSRIQYLKKGTYVGITGLPDEQAYIKKDGSLDVQHNLLGDRIEFLRAGKKDDNNRQTTNETRTYQEDSNVAQGNAYVPPVSNQAPVAEPNIQPSVQPIQTQVETPVQKVAPTNVPVSNNEDEGDDLPF